MLKSETVVREHVALLMALAEWGHGRDICDLHSLYFLHICYNIAFSVFQTKLLMPTIPILPMVVLMLLPFLRVSSSKIYNISSFFFINHC